MNARRALLGAVSCFLALCIPVQGANWFEGIFQGAKCFDEWDKPDTCPEEKLWDIFEPEWNRTGVNSPETYLFLMTPECEGPEFIHDCGGQLPADTKFNPALPTVIVIHGWIDGVCRSAWMREYNFEFQRRAPHNVILVDWTWGSSFDTSLTMDNAIVAGQQLAFVVKNLVTLNGLNVNQLYLIGANYGGHLAGIAARYINSQLGMKVARITALDPGFPDRELDYRLDPTDANFVDIVHTGGGFCPFKILDEKYELGHAEYFVNGGQTFAQFACVPYIILSALKADVWYGFISLTPWTCANLHSIQYYKSTIVPEDTPMVGVECESWDDFSGGSCKSCGEDGTQCALFGFDAPMTLTAIPEATKRYYLETSLMCPYVKNDGIDFGGFPYGKYCVQGQYESNDGGVGGGFLTEILNATGQVISSVFGGAASSVLGGLGGGAEDSGGGGGPGEIVAQVVGGLAGGGGGGITGSLTGGITGGGGGGGGGGLTGGITGGLSGGGGGKGKGKKKGGGGLLG